MIAHEVERELRVPSNLNVEALADAERPLEPDALRAYIADEVDGAHVSIGRAKRGRFKKAGHRANQPQWFGERAVEVFAGLGAAPTPAAARRVEAGVLRAGRSPMAFSGLSVRWGGVRKGRRWRCVRGFGAR